MATLNLDQYGKKSHTTFAHEFVRVGKFVAVVYRQMGYTAKSKIYGTVFDVECKAAGIDARVKTKAQVIKLLKSLENGK